MTMDSFRIFPALLCIPSEIITLYGVFCSRVLLICNHTSLGYFVSLYNGSKETAFPFASVMAKFPAFAAIVTGSLIFYEKISLIATFCGFKSLFPSSGMV